MRKAANIGKLRPHASLPRIRSPATPSRRLVATSRIPNAFCFVRSTVPPVDAAAGMVAVPTLVDLQQEA
ncbi:MAG: hypothetical protein ACHQ50_11175 [Fimbriimonadales bacterium]